MRQFFILFVFLLMAIVSPAAAKSYDTTVVMALDKITGRTSTLTLPNGKPETFGALSITARACHKSAPEETPESAAFLEISETSEKDKKTTRIFRGWMFASSPALSAIENPTYDVWVEDCR